MNLVIEITNPYLGLAIAITGLDPTRIRNNDKKKLVATLKTFVKLLHKGAQCLYEFRRRELEAAEVRRLEAEALRQKQENWSSIREAAKKFFF